MTRPEQHILITTLICLLLLPVAVWCQDSITIGILAYRPKELMREDASSLQKHLERQLGNVSVRVQPLNYLELEAAIANRQLDFVLTNPSHYIKLRIGTDFSGAIATAIENEHGRTVASIGGVIVTLVERGDINTLTDLKGKRVAAISDSSLGGFQAQVLVLQQAGLNYRQDMNFFFTDSPHDRVLELLQKRSVDAAFVRSGVIENMAAEGKLDLKRFKIINRQEISAFPFALSTRLYPHWPFVALPHVSDHLSRGVAAALLSYHPSTNRKITGFTIPADYSTVENLMKELRLPPYDSQQAISADDVWNQYGRQIIAVLAVIAGGSVVTLLLLLSNRRIRGANRTARSAQQALRNLYDIIPDAIYVHEIPGGRVVDCNDSACAALGRSREEVLQLTVADIDADFSPERDEATWDALHTGSSITLESRHRRADGSTFPVEIHLILFDDGNRQKVVAVSRDISERRRLEEDLRRTESKYATIFRNSPDLIAITEVASGRYFEVNEAYERIMGFSRNEVLGKTSLELNTWGSAEDREHMKQELTGASRLMNYRTTFRRKSGEVFPALVSLEIAEMYDTNCFIISARDISQQVKIEEELQASRDAAEAANRAKSEFLANMSHEIRTPMNGILGMVQLMEMTELSADQKEYLTILKTSGDSLLSLINDILDLSRVESGRLQLEQTPFSLRVAIDNICTIQRGAAHIKKLVLQKQISDDIPDLLLGDQLRFRQVLLNLVANAIKFTEQGSVTLTVRLLESHDNGITLDILVQDTGIGIEPEKQELIFSPFTQADASTTRRHGGSGLGLTISRRLARLMGGDISVVSAPGQGATFHFTVPFVTGDTLLIPDSSDAACPPWDDPPLTILVAEDNLINQRYLSAVLERMGHRYRCVSDGLHALECWRSEPWDCILMDIQMPGMGGREALNLIRGEEATTGRHTPLIALTAHALRHDRERFLAEGFDDFIAKPFTPGDLHHALKKLASGLAEPAEEGTVHAAL